MSKEAIVQAIEDLLRQHKDGLRGSVHQEPYKGDIFRQFSAAYNEGLLDRSIASADYLSADVLADILVSRAPDLLIHNALREIQTFWLEWTYAWHHARLKH